MGRLDEIAAAHAGRPAERAKEDARYEFEQEQRRQARLSEARKAAMAAALSTTGRVIFPGRWTAEPAEQPMRGSGWEYRCTSRWEGLRFIFHWRTGSAGATFGKLEAQVAGEKPRIVESEGQLAEALRIWGVA